MTRPVAGHDQPHIRSPPRRLHQDPAAADGARADDTILLVGVLSHGRSRFVHPDPPDPRGSGKFAIIFPSKGSQACFITAPSMTTPNVTYSTAPPAACGPGRRWSPSSVVRCWRRRARTALDRGLATVVRPIVIDPAAVESFGRMMRQNIATGETPFRKAYLRAVVDHIEVDDHVIRIIGDKATLEQAIAGQAVNASDVRRCAPKWRARRDSNSYREISSLGSFGAARLCPLWRGPKASLSARHGRDPVAARQALASASAIDRTTTLGPLGRLRSFNVGKAHVKAGRQAPMGLPPPRPGRWGWLMRLGLSSA